MLDIALLREDPDRVKKGIQSKGASPDLVDQFLVLDQKWRALVQEVDSLRALQNTLSKERKIEEAKKNKETLKAKEEEVPALEKERDAVLAKIPNVPFPDVPLGKSEADNKVLRSWGTPTKFDFEPKDHLTLGQDLQLIDFESGAKVTGSQFYYLSNDAVLLEFALQHYVLKLLSPKGFIPIITPDLAKERYYLGTGYAPKGEEAQTYKIEDSDLGLIATAEVTLAGKHADEIIPAESLPIKYLGFSHAFRQESGAYGKYSHGLYRVHQFTKVEMFVYCLPEDSSRMHEELLFLEEKIYQDLEIPYRVLEMCTRDLGAMAARKFDIEAWMPARNEYGEVTSTSNCTDYQARNLMIRFKRKNGEIGYAHMLNGTALALSRTLIAILENYQTKEGEIRVPKVLQPYMGKERIARAK
jgi:seryl-tRNA synthetase